MSDKSSVSYRPARLPLDEAILHVRENAAKQHIPIGDNDIAQALGISSEEFRQYVADNTMPDALFGKFEKHFSAFYTLLIAVSVQNEEIPDPFDEEEAE
ncbi:hypothetical protein HHL16_23160 [Pseudoflavitalea sp. G-6-1-2]|uniref:hypothetical protein n=1 Tax=Pseudoflavitalea sp. G-6-1-2 TaxID=2728841 RepID=UPI00146A5A52|nr:hypothetical protein [Pseudoflavitalea sp. G-6-1-2]NML23800.1 hypothetical protein [Pseudoflavitalea sp. G-6-1-2]